MDSKDKVCPLEALTSMARLNMDNSGKWDNKVAGLYSYVKRVNRPAGALVLAYVLTKELLQCTITINGRHIAIRLEEGAKAAELFEAQEDIKRQLEKRKQLANAEQILEHIVADHPLRLPEQEVLDYNIASTDYWNKLTQAQFDHQRAMQEALIKKEEAYYSQRFSLFGDVFGKKK